MFHIGVRVSQGELNLLGYILLMDKNDTSLPLHLHVMLIIQRYKCQSSESHQKDMATTDVVS